MKQTNFLSFISKAGVLAFVVSVLMLDSCKEKVEPADTTSPEASFTYTADELVVSFVNTSKGASADAPYAWTFDQGSPASSTEEGTVEAPIVVTFASEGTYDVTLTANRANGKTDMVTRKVTVSKTPVAEFSFTSIGRTTTFTNESANAESYTWDFGDGSALDTEKNPVHTFPKNEAYTVKLIAKKGAQESEVMKDVTVLGPTADFSFTVDDKTVAFENLSDDAVSYEWDFDDGSPKSTDETPADHTYADYGTYNVQLVATGSDTATDTVMMEVTLVPLPTAAFTYVGAGLAVTFTNASADASEYTWDFGDGNTSSDENPLHTYAAAGNYMVKLIAKNQYGFDDTKRAWFGVAAAGAAYATFINGNLDGYGLNAQRDDQGCTEDCITSDDYQDNNDAWEKPDHWTGNDGFRAGGMSSDGKKLDDDSKTNGLKMANNNNRGGYQEVAVENGASYTVTFDVAGDEVTGTNVRLDAYLVNQRIFAEDDANLASAYQHFEVLDTDLTGKGNFTTLSHTFTATSDVLTFFMLETEHTNNSSSEVWVDNITLTKN